MTRRSAAQQAAWRRLPPRYRWLIASEHPDPIEQDENLTRDTMADMEAAYGPREWTAAAARQEDGERDGDDGKESPYAMTLGEIGAVLGICGNRVREIEAGALRKLRHPSRLALISDKAVGEDLRDRTLAGVDAALAVLRDVAKAPSVGTIHAAGYLPKLARYR